MKLDRDELIRARERLGYAVETVAEEARVSKNSVLRAEHGQDIRPLTARKIAAALGVAVADLYREPDYPNSEAPPSLFNDLEEERRLEDEAALTVLFRGLARRARLIVQRSRREGPSAELGEDAAALHVEASALYRLRRLRARRDIFGTGSDELADAVDAYVEVEGTIQAMLRQDVEATDEERDTARRFRPGTDDATKLRDADAS